jgi:hypothetical protein
MVPSRGTGAGLRGMRKREAPSGARLRDAVRPWRCPSMGWPIGERRGHGGSQPAFVYQIPPDKFFKEYSRAAERCTRGCIVNF